MTKIDNNFYDFIKKEHEESQFTEFSFDFDVNRSEMLCALVSKKIPFTLTNGKFI